MQHPQQVERDAFEIAIICALSVESNAVEAAFDRFFKRDELLFDTRRQGDPNSYTFGIIGQHNVLLVYMPGMGKASSASVSASLRGSFPNIRLGLVVGICGAVPELGNKKIFLGDIIISTGVAQVDFGQRYTGHFVRKDTLDDNLGRPNTELRGFLRRLSGWKEQQEFNPKFLGNIRDICGKKGFSDWTKPTLEIDTLYSADYGHRHRNLRNCSVCAQVGEERPVFCESALSMSCEQLGCNNVSRKREAEDVPVCHFGHIASSDQVMKSALDRDRIANQEKVLGFEMEGAGVWDNFPTVIIKGACDYADSHKNKTWQRYASVTAAAGAKAFLQQWEVSSRDFTRMAESQGFEYFAGNGSDQRLTMFDNTSAKIGNQGYRQTISGPITMNFS
ncbi:nucleoside phosphorylase domain-containing protein [Aspergillus taichungensis]|uniref:Nucleoside phosphorylase domain-containing protein n=1 Tax=Aspergillus taichungensis TaxID=482145 RepID=A0A2J5HMB6_9EURO|nr:nucleoside phosphorylase domain-containing protein [Aspergillus taichungensis]